MCGVDYHLYTLRELFWMVKAKLRTMGDLAAWHVAHILARMPITAVALDPREINPYRFGESKATTEAMEKLKAWQARRIWQVMHTPERK